MTLRELALMQDMTPDQRMLFQMEYGREARNRRTARFLTLVLGGIGGHRFYLRQRGLGVLYLVFCWTFVPAIIAFVELFLIGGRVDRYNRRRAAELAAEVRLFRAAA